MGNDSEEFVGEMNQAKTMRNDGEKFTTTNTPADTLPYPQTKAA